MIASIFFLKNHYLKSAKAPKVPKTVAIDAETKATLTECHAVSSKESKEIKFSYQIVVNPFPFNTIFRIIK